MSNETVARRYATALADVIAKTGETENIKNELETWEAMMNGNGEILQVFLSPAFPQNQKEKVLESLIERTKPAPTTANFLRVLLKNGRLGEISQINQKFSSILEGRSGGVSARIVSARLLSDTEKQELKSSFEKITGKRLSPSYEIDESIIGGVVITIGSTVYDGSVKTQLQQLKEQMMHA